MGRRWTCLLMLAAAALLAGGCQTFPTDRISAHRAEYDSWPREVQQKVRAGLVDVGYTPAQVFIALGDPTARSEAGPPGNLTEVWVYHRRAARFGFAVGGMSFDRDSAVGGGVAVNGMKLGLDVDGRVIFTNGRVTNVEILQR